MKMSKILKTDGKWSWRKIGAALMVPVIMFCLSTAYGRYSWMRDQCYKVATNEKSIIQAGEALKAKDKSLDKKIDELKAEMKKGEGILHSRMSKETDKRENKDDKLMGLIFEMLKQQQKSMEIQQKQIEQGR